MNDPISDMLIRIKNAGMAGKSVISIPYSKLKYSIIELLNKEGYVGDFFKKGKKNPSSIELNIIFKKDGSPRVQEVKRLSKPSSRFYLKSTEIKPVKRGLGIVVLSTPNGIVTGLEAKKNNVGGEALFKIY